MTRPDMSIKVERQLHDMRILGRIVGVRSTEQFVWHLLNIITANIVANAIMSLAPAVPGLMADGAVFIASGIIDSRKDEVIAALEAAGLAVLEVKEKRGWECIVCKKA